MRCDRDRSRLDIIIGAERVRARIVGLGCEPRLTIVGSEHDSIVYPSSGFQRYDALLGELIAIARLGFIRLSVIGSHRHVHEQLRIEHPELYSDDPVDRLVFSFLSRFLRPSRVVGPGLLDFISTVARLARVGAELVDVRALRERRLTSDTILGKLVAVGAKASGFKFSVPTRRITFSSLYEEMLRRHYPETYNVLVEDTGLGSLFPVFEDPALYLLTYVDVFEELLNTHLRAWSRLPARVEAGRREERTYNLRLRLYTPTMRLLVDAPIALSPERAARLAEEASKVELTDCSPITLLMKYYEEDRLTEAFKDTYVFTSPGRIVYVSPREGVYLTAGNIRELQRLARHAPVPMLGDVSSILLRMDSLKRLGDRFYESPEQERAVLLTGCPVCRRHTLINNSLALAEADGKWILGALPIMRSVPVRVKARSPRLAFYSPSIIQELTMLVLDGAEEYAPELVTLNRFTWTVWEELGQLITLVDMVMAPWSGPGRSYLLYIVFNRHLSLNTTSLESNIGRITFLDDDEDDYEHHISRNTRRLEEESRSWLPVPERAVETLVRGGFEPVLEHETYTAYKHENIYVFLRNKPSLS